MALVRMTRWTLSGKLLAKLVLLMEDIQQVR
jgi:hypothetical protein